MAYVNIPRDRDDPNYRYKMPRLYSKIEGRGNGIKTNISNMGEIAKALKRPPMYPTKFFGCELGAQCKYEEAEEKSLVNGAHLEKDLVEILDKFITMYVLCPGCLLPEMDIIVKKGMLSCKCNACGHTSALDMTHKAATYMIRNPPDQNVSTVVTKKKSKEERRAEKIKRGGCGDDVEEETEDKKKKEKKEKKKKEKDDKGEKKVKKNKSRDISEDDNSPSESDKTPRASQKAKEITRLDSDEIVGSVEMEEERTPVEGKKKKKKSELDGERLQFNDKLHFGSVELVEVIQRLRAHLDMGLKTSPSEFFQEVRLLQVAQDFDSKVRLYVVMAALFNQDINADDFEAKLPYLKKMIDSSMRPEETFEVLEFFTNSNCSGKPLPQYPYLVQKIYKHQLMGTDDILKHYRRDEGDEHFLKCRKAAEPVLAWLDENDTEEDEDSDDEESKTNTP